MIACNLRIGVVKKQKLLANFDPMHRLVEVMEILEAEIQRLDPHGISEP